MHLNTLGSLGGHFRGWLGPVGHTIVWGGYGPGLRISSPGWPIARLGWRFRYFDIDIMMEYTALAESMKGEY